MMSKPVSEAIRRSDPVSVRQLDWQPDSGYRLRATVGWLLTAALMIVAGSTVVSGQPISVDPTNGHYFTYHGKPILLISSDHHYGGVLDRGFDFVKFLNYMGDNQMNLSRIYPGAYVEAPDQFTVNNPLGPPAGRQVLLWAKSSQTGANPALAEPGQPSYKFDLDKWNPEYFARLKEFVGVARQRDIIVEIAFFNGMYTENWPVVPFYHGNNVNGVGQYEAEDCRLFCTLDPRNAGVVERQKAYIAKITAELNDYDNVIFDICDEPIDRGLTDADVAPWVVTMKDAFLAAESRLPKKHVLGQTVRGARSPTMSSESWNQWLPTEYIKYAEQALVGDYVWNKPIVRVETTWYGSQLPHNYDDVSGVRLEAWNFMVGGGAGHINLNGEYYGGQETGGHDTHTTIVPQLKVLRDFLNSFDYVHMRRLTDYTVSGGAVLSAMAENGKQYALYIFHGSTDTGYLWKGAPGNYQDEITLNTIPEGKYKLEWIDPATGVVKQSETRTHPGAKFIVKTPAFSLDLALRMLAK